MTTSPTELELTSSSRSLPASSLKAKLFSAPSPSDELEVVATASASNIGAKGKQVELKVKWAQGEGSEKVEKKDQGDVECEFSSPLRQSSPP